MRNLECDPKTLVGPVDGRVVANLQKRYPLDPVYLKCMEACHGGIPRICEFDVGEFQSQIGQFLALLDNHSPLAPPMRPHFDDFRMDERVVNSIDFVTGYEHATSRALFSGDLLPFAVTRANMCLDRAYVDLICFDYREKRERPPIVYWMADDAHHAYMNWEDRPTEEQFGGDGKMINVPWEDFLLPIASDFSEFVEKLRPRTGETV